jgi:RimJ/RimL family protein N-acetyltransferase
MIGHVACNREGPEELLTWNHGYIFNPAFYGKGYATEASRRILQHAFEELGAHRVQAGCNPDNAPSWRLLERLGRKACGDLSAVPIARLR